jgi:2-oxo-4-hydroxy-4-carboxy-5-ureidoimidazoline decarboxylase
MSRSEQAGVDPHDAEVRERLAAGNAAYEERFDRIYLVRAAGRSADEILALLEERLGNDPETELAVTAGQLREIAVLRLKGLFS